MIGTFASNSYGTEKRENPEIKKNKRSGRYHLLEDSKVDRVSALGGVQVEGLSSLIPSSNLFDRNLISRGFTTQLEQPKTTLEIALAKTPSGNPLLVVARSDVAHKCVGLGADNGGIESTEC